MDIVFFEQDPTFRWTFWGTQRSPRESVQIRIFSNSRRTAVPREIAINRIGWSKIWAGMDPSGGVFHALLRNTDSTYSHFNSKSMCFEPFDAWEIKETPISGEIDQISGLGSELRIKRKDSLWGVPQGLGWSPLGMGGLHFGWDHLISEKVGDSFESLKCSFPNYRGFYLAGQSGHTVRIFRGVGTPQRGCELVDLSSHSPYSLVSVHPFGGGVLLKGRESSSDYAVKFTEYANLVHFRSDIPPTWTRLGGILKIEDRMVGRIRPPETSVIGQIPEVAFRVWEDLQGSLWAVNGAGKLLTVPVCPQQE